MTPCIHLCVSPIFRTVFFPLPSPLLWIQESYWFFSVCSFLPIVRIEWPLLSSLQKEMEIGSLNLIFSKYITLYSFLNLCPFFLPRGFLGFFSNLISCTSPLKVNSNLTKAVLFRDVLFNSRAKSQKQIS